MKTNPCLLPIPRSVVLMCAGLCGLAGILPAAEKKEPPLENYIDFSYGYPDVSGDEPGFQKYFQINKDGYGGIEDMYLTKSLNDTTNMVFKGRALAGNYDYLLDFVVTKDEVGYLKFGYKSFRVWYDGSGGYWPPKDLMILLYDEDLHVDRSNLWFEAGFNKPEAVNFVLRYDLQTKTGKKDSTSWMDTGLPINAANTRYIVPTFLKFDETRHILNATLSQAKDKSEWALGARYDKGDYENGRYSRRRPYESSTDRLVTAKEGQDYDMFQLRGSYVTDLTEQIKLTTAVARTKLDTILSGSRIFGTSYDADYTSNYPTRQQRDEGYFGLLAGNQLGESEMTQTVATISALYLATEKLRITPGLRFEKTEWGNHIEFEETNFGAGPAYAPINDEVEAKSDKHWKTYAASFDVRYAAAQDVNLNFKADWSNSEGELEEERILEPGTPLQVISIDRDTELERGTQKYAVTANWYAKPGTSVAVQYYYKARQNDYSAIRDNTVSTSDRYPAYIANQDFETNDFNIRLTWRLSPAFSSVTRYDYMATTIRTQDVGLAFLESMNSTQHIISESINWNPTARWYVQGNVNYVNDTLTTPAKTLTGLAGGLVKNSDANYLNLSLSTGYALDDQSDLYVDYMRYEAMDNYVNNSALTVPYGTDSTLQTFSTAWTRRMNRRTTLTLKYTYAKNEDVPYGNYADYEAHLLYAKLQYRF